MQRAPFSIVLAILLLLLTAQAVLGAKPVHDKYRFEETFTEDLCGIMVTTHLEVKGNVLIFEDRFVDVSQVRLTWTNAEGDWLENFIAGPVFFSEQLDGDILTFTSRHAGVHERLRSSAGLTAAFDRGQIVFQTVIDINDPEDSEDDLFVSFDILLQAGPHPEADSDFVLFCEVVHDVLG